MVSLLDEAIANLTNSLEKNGLLDNSILVFTSDVIKNFYTKILFFFIKYFLLNQNGGAILDHQRNFPLRGGKSSVFEGGHRVRAFISMKNIIPSVYDGMFHSVDWIPTILSAAIDMPLGI